MKHRTKEVEVEMQSRICSVKQQLTGDKSYIFFINTKILFPLKKSIRLILNFKIAYRQGII